MFLNKQVISYPMVRGLKSWCLVLFILICSVYVFAATETITLTVGGSTEINGVNFTLLGTNTNGDKVLICVNNEKVIISGVETVGNAIIRVKDIFSESANLQLEVSCPDICVCGSDCSNDVCLSSAPPKVECVTDTDCDDSNPNTLDHCVQGVCQHNPVPLQSCISNADCNDNNPCTVDECSQVIKKCVHTEIQGCNPSTPPTTGQQQQPSPTHQQPAPKIIPLYMLSAYILLGVVLLLLIALVLKRFVR